MSELRAEDLSFGFPGRSLLFNRINLEVRTGELHVVLGGNATGKTTLLKILAGLLHPSSGGIVIDGKMEDERHNQIGLLFQNPEHQMIEATVEEEIALGLELRGTDPSTVREAVDRMLRRFDLADYATSPPEALSGGQKQRVALAAIMITLPAFVLLDEPDSFLDAPSRRELMRGVDEVRDACGIVWATPHPGHLPQADSYSRLNGGRLEPSSRAELVALSRSTFR